MGENEGSGPAVEASHKLLTDLGIERVSESGQPVWLPGRIELLGKKYRDAQQKSASELQAHEVLDLIGSETADRYRLGLAGRVQSLVWAYRDAKAEVVAANQAASQAKLEGAQAVAQLAAGAIQALDEVDAPPGPSVPARIKALAEQHAQELAGARLDAADVSALRTLVEQHGHVYGVGGTYDRNATVDYSDPADVVDATRDLISRLLAEVATKTIERDEARRERDEAQARHPAALSLAQARLDVAAETLAMGDKVPAALRAKILTLILV